MIANSFRLHTAFLLRMGTFLVMLCSWSSPAQALQTHGGKEGIYAHQGAHIFFFVSMVFFAIHIFRSQIIREKARLLFFWGAFLLSCWNVWAFSGHIIEYFVPSQHFILSDVENQPRLLIDSWKEIFYYFLKMDHLLCLPAIICFYFGLRATSTDFTQDYKERLSR